MKKKDLSYKYCMMRYKKTEKQKNKKYFKKKINYIVGKFLDGE